MPPAAKSKVQKGQEKADQKKKEKVAEDLTFGLKNKNKSKTVQKYIKSVQTQVASSGGKQVSDEVKQSAEFQKKEEKKKQLQQAALLASLFKGTENIKKLTIDNNAKRGDPRAIKMDQRIDLYTDQRAQQNQTMATWDQEELESVIAKRHGAQETTTDIICKHFLDALESQKYGWFWVCPNGADECKYKHCLPPGYVLKRNQPKADDMDAEDEKPLEELIEEERAALPPGGTPVTLESFLAWKKRKLEEKETAKKVAEEKARKERGGRQDLSGRDLFSFDPSLFIDDEFAALLDTYAHEEDAGWSSDEEGEDKKKGGEEEAAEGEGGGSVVGGEDEQDDDDEQQTTEPSNQVGGTTSSSSSSKQCDHQSEGSKLELKRKELFATDEDLPDDLSE